ncbi:hypothetical protein INR49_020370 [Caranx melampygus]|nr:hypothetical protein INR49_020370 [Caranx melampygus]
MEGGVTRKFVHADSSHIISFCGTETPLDPDCTDGEALRQIVLYLVENSSAFYEKEAMLMDPVDGPILASLLVGPCALEYTKVKTADHFWTDPSADELVQRHRIHSGHCRQDSPSRRPALIQKRQSSGSMDDRPLMWVREYVESLHQNSRATLLFGKNNVLVQPRDDMEAIPGYLSLHQTADLMTLKWTPNQLMNGNVGELDSEKGYVYWDYAMTIRLEEIVYLHCHQQVNSGGTVVLVSQDGIQRPPLHFPKGGHLLQFLTCLRLACYLMDSWTHRSGTREEDKEDDEATDYVFRILFPGNQMEFIAPVMIGDIMLFSGSRADGPGVNMWQPTPRKSSCSSCSQNGSSDGSLPNGCNQERAPLKLLCDTMKYQIISRAFYGWLAYCRHLSTVRTHLSALVNTTIVDPDVPCDAQGGLTVEVWGRFLKGSAAYEEKEIHRLVYFGGVDPSLRKEVWPFLLGHYQFSMTEKSRMEIDEQMRIMYEQTLKEWQGCEAIVRQREREKHAEALARCSSGASVERGPVQRDSTISTDAILRFTSCVTLLPLQSSLSSSSDHQNATSQSDSSSSAQVFGSVEAVDQIEPEPKPEEGRVQHSSPMKDITKSTVGSTTSQTSADASEVLTKKNTIGSEPEGADGMDPVAKDKISETENMETVTESEVPEETGVSKSKETSEDEEKPKSPDTADSDDSPSALEMEDIPAGITCVTSEDIKARPLAGLAAPPISLAQREKMASEGLVLDHHLDTACNTSPEGTDLGLSEDEPEMENVLTEPESADMGGDTKHDESSEGQTYSQETLDMYLINLHRIDKDVRRCDRTYWYFTSENLEKLRNIMCSYVWQHLDTGYVQGMCDLLAPLLVILDDEVMAFSCFTELMKRMNQNFPHGGAMDSHFANMRSLIQILDSELFELMQQNGDYTHFYFCYRWFLLDFKREMVYGDVFSVWETIWAAKHTSSEHFVLFIALALVEMYRDIILENNMDFTDIIKFFNEMAERHNVPQVLMMARDLVHKVQTLIENK